MKIVNNLVFGGDCKPAFEFYAELLGGKITAMIPFGEAPPGMPLPEGFKDKIMHAWLEIGDQAIMGCDSPPEYFRPMGGFSVAVHTKDPEEARRLFDALAQGGRAAMPFGPTSWSPAFGMLTDRFGAPWIINTNPEL